MLDELFYFFRFRTKSKKDANKSLSVEKKPARVHVTNPKTPLLLTKTRHRPVNVESAKEIEEKEVEAMMRLVLILK